MSTPLMSTADDLLFPTGFAPTPRHVVEIDLQNDSANNLCAALRRELPSDDALQVIALRQFSELEPWRDQCHTLAGGVPFLQWQWLESWWNNYGQRAPLLHQSTRDPQLALIAVLDSRQQLVALAPWYLESVPGGLRRLRWIGAGEVCADHLTVLCQSGRIEPAAAAIASWLTDEKTGEAHAWDSLEVAGVVRQDPFMSALLAQLHEKDCRFRARKAQHGWRIELPATWPDYVAELSKSHRKQVRRLERAVDDGTTFTFHVAQTPRQVEQAMNIVVHLHQLRWRQQGEPGCFASLRFQTFHREVAQRLIATGNIRLLWLEADGNPIAAEYQLLGNGGVYAYQSGIDPAQLDLEPGRLLSMLSIRYAISRGNRFYDLLRGDEPYKAHWRAKPYEMLEGDLVAPRLAARLKYALWAASTRLERWLVTRATRWSRGAKAWRAARLKLKNEADSRPLAETVPIDKVLGLNLMMQSDLLLEMAMTI